MRVRARATRACARIIIISFQSFFVSGPALLGACVLDARPPARAEDIGPSGLADRALLYRIGAVAPGGQIAYLFIICPLTITE